MVCEHYIISVFYILWTIKNYKLRLKVVFLFLNFVVLSVLFVLTLQALVKRNQDLTPSEKESSAIINLVYKVQGVLDTLIITPGAFDSCVSTKIKYRV